VAKHVPEPGDPAPDFTLAQTDGSDVSLRGLRGRTVVVYFYPKDMTPGCTTQACDFRDRIGTLEKEGAVVLGISPDSLESHRKFAAEHSLPFPLLSDPDHVVQEAYGVRKNRTLYGRTFLGVERSTFVIDGTGVIRKAWRRVKVDGHAEEVLEAVREVQAGKR
jgi:peroxiredoxin Q/BCP